MGSIREKLRALWEDKRSWKVRLPLAILSPFAFVFTFILFGPCEIFIQNMQEMPFPFLTLAPALLLAGGAVFGALLLALLLLRGKLFNLAVSLLFAGTLAGYLQGNFLNIERGSLDGSAVYWQGFKFPMLQNCLAWLLIFGAVFLLLYLSRKAWTRGIELACTVLIGAQAVAFIVLLVQAGPAQVFRVGQEKAYVSRDGIYEVAPKNNVIVFLLDRLDNRFTDEALALHPEWAQRLGGFTYYHDFTGSYANTRPSIAYFMTGVRHDYTVPWEDYFQRAWSEPVYPFLPDIHNAGYKTRIYSDCAYVFGEAENVEGVVDNIRRDTHTVHRRLMLVKMLGLSAYRYAPEAMKPYFQMYSGELGDVVSVHGADGGNSLFTVDDVAFWKGYREYGLTVDPDAQGAFQFYHFEGAHYPYVMDENAQPVTGGTRNGQIAGNMEMIFRYLDELEDIGLFEDATIIITTDHARPPEKNGDLSDVSGSRVSTLMIKPAGTGRTQPLATSNKQVCQDNLRASIISYFGLDGSAYGRTIESIGEGEQMTRYLWMRGEAGSVADKLFTFRITGDANDFSNWELIDEDTMDYIGL